MCYASVQFVTSDAAGVHVSDVLLCRVQADDAVAAWLQVSDEAPCFAHAAIAGVTCAQTSEAVLAATQVSAVGACAAQAITDVGAIVHTSTASAASVHVSLVGPSGTHL